MVRKSRSLARIESYGGLLPRITWRRGRSHRAIPDVPTLQNFLWSTSFCHVEHGPDDFFGRQDISRKKAAQQWEHRFGQSVADTVSSCFGADPVQRLNYSKPEHICRFEGQAKNSVFGLTFHARPHDAPLLRAVSPGAGDVNESH